MGAKVRMGRVWEMWDSPAFADPGSKVRHIPISPDKTIRSFERPFTCLVPLIVEVPVCMLLGADLAQPPPLRTPTAGPDDVTREFPRDLCPTLHVRNQPRAY
jgi:hypothetical protein